MKVSEFLWTALLFCTISTSLFAEETIKSSDTGASFPKEVSFKYEGKDYNLKATGVATRKIFFVKIYSIASYLQENKGQKGNIIEQIMNPDNAKELIIKWVRDVGGKRVEEGYHEAFEKVLTKEEADTLKDEITEFASYFKDGVKNGEENVLRWIPGGVVEVDVNGKTVGTIKSEPFAKALWSIWFGSDSVVNRSDLVLLMK